MKRITRLVLVAVLMVGFSCNGAQIDYPRSNQVIQQVSGKASFHVTKRGAVTNYTLRSAGKIIDDNTTGLFTAPVGWYKLSLVRSGIEIANVNIGVGDVYLVAGQSNAVSVLQPHDYTPERPSGPGKVILHDIGGNAFLDAYDTPMGTPFSGVAWISCGIALNRSYPVMFVNVAKGATSTADWVNVLVGRIADGAVVHKPRAILWHQGESDAALRFTQDVSFRNMNLMVKVIRSITSAPWLMAINSTNGGYAPIRAAQQQVIDAWPHVHQGPDTDPLRNRVDVEFLGSELRAHGALWAAALRAAGL